jgi:hypothetical protein
MMPILDAYMPSAMAFAVQTLTRQAAAPANLRDLGRQLKVGDAVFIRIPLLPFRKVADTTGSWTNHVGIVVDISGGEPVIAESRVPFSGTASWSRFVGRSAGGRVALARLKVDLNDAEREHLQQAASKRYGILYDTGFNLYSRRQFCSRFVREVLYEATGTKLGEVESFSTLLARNPNADQRFWRVWYFGAIPWKRETVTPASLLMDEKLVVYFDGNAG